jgi:glycosyltransferase involved in cell wall biosynthesis
MMKLPEVSIVVPVYNAAGYLKETLTALLSQSFANFELLVIDDGSKDGSGEIALSLKDDRIRVIRQENRGLCHALNRGIEEARATYIARNDHDDISFPHRLERQLSVMKEHPDALGLFAYYAKFGARHRWSNTDKFIPTTDKVRPYDPLKDGCLLCSTMFARTEALRSLQGFRQEYYPADDWDLELRFSQTGKVLVICEPLVTYRFHSGANTYRLFAPMQQKSRWAEDSYQRRLQDAPELTFEEFLAAQPDDWGTRLERRRIDTAKLKMRTAGQNYLDGRYFSAACQLTAAAVLNPMDLVQRVARLRHRPS